MRSNTLTRVSNNPGAVHSFALRRHPGPAAMAIAPVVRRSTPFGITHDCAGEAGAPDACVAS